MSGTLRPLLPVVAAALLCMAFLDVCIHAQPLPMPAAVQISLSVGLGIAIGILLVLVHYVERDATHAARTLPSATDRPDGGTTTPPRRRPPGEPARSVRHYQW